jgi:hypothetical protein
VDLFGLYIFFPISWEGWFLGILTDINEKVNHWLKRIGTLMGVHGRTALPVTLREK